MKKNTKITLGVLATIFCVVYAGIWMLRRTPVGHVLWPPRNPPTVSDVPVFVTPAACSPSLDRLDLRVRSINEDDQAILITRGKTWVPLADIPDQWTVYRYDGGTRTLSAVEPVEWHKAGGSIAEPLGGDPGYEFFWRHLDGVVKYRVGPGPLQEFTTRGEYAVSLTASPNGKIICVLTADRPKRPKSPGPGMVFGTLGGGYYGQHRLEMFQLPEMTPVGEAVRIPFTTVKGIDIPCWSPDGRFLVYSNYEGTKMCVIHVDQGGKKP